MRRVFVAAAVLAGLVGEARAAGPVSLAPDDVIAARQAGFALQGGIAEAMKAAVAGGQPVKPFVEAAKALAAWGRVIPSQFPDGTQTGHDTKAKAEIWSDAAGFAKASAALVEAADKLAVLAEADDKAGFAEQFQATGKTCGACHRAYRVRRE